MLPTELIEHATRLLAAPATTVSGADCRRAVSAAYYALFHALTLSGAGLVAAGGSPALLNQVGPAFNHGPMRQVCSVYEAAQRRPFAAPFDVLVTSIPSAQLFNVARLFLRLQGARQAADYDMLATFSISDAQHEVEFARQAVADWDTIKTTPEARVFLTALLLAERWTRRG